MSNRDKEKGTWFIQSVCKVSTGRLVDNITIQIPCWNRISLFLFLFKNSLHYTYLKFENKVWRISAKYGQILSRLLFDCWEFLQGRLVTTLLLYTINGKGWLNSPKLQSNISPLSCRCSARGPAPPPCGTCWTWWRSTSRTTTRVRLEPSRASTMTWVARITIVKLILKLSFGSEQFFSPQQEHKHNSDKTPACLLWTVEGEKYILKYCFCRFVIFTRSYFSTPAFVVRTKRSGLWPAPGAVWRTSQPDAAKRLTPPPLARDGAWFKIFFCQKK